ncbi:uncharacterized protein [Procambarus clarkii]|uniref:uncharacterized protein n=1 Tax=Procambarus clarkii TaxID=6728 RepID=UPI0037426D7C
MTQWTPVVPPSSPPPSPPGSLASGESRTPTPKARRGREETTGNSMANKPPQHKDYLSQQRAKRLGKPRPKGKNDGIRGKERAKQRESSNDKVNEDSVEARDASRIPSAGSNTSKDEGISSNTEKDEDFELEGESEIKTVTKEADDIEDDEGRGSINGDEEVLHPDHQSDAEAAAAGEPNAEHDADNTDENTQEDPPDNNLDESETVNIDPEAEDPGEKAEDMPNDIEEDNTGYQGDMDEPNSLATSFQGSLGLSSDAGLGAIADTAVPENSENAEPSSENAEPSSENAEPSNENAEPSSENAEPSNEEQANEATENFEVDTDLAGEAEETNDEANPVTASVEEQAEALEAAGNDSQDNDSEEKIADEGEEGGEANNIEAADDGEPGDKEAIVDDSGAGNNEPIDGGEVVDNEPTDDVGEALDNEPTIDDGEAEAVEATVDGEENASSENNETVVAEEEKDGEAGEGNSPVNPEVPDSSEVQAESDLPEAASDAPANEDPSLSQQPLNEEEEIKEIPAIAKIPGTYRGKRKLAAKSLTQEPEVKKSTQIKQNDRSKIMTNRKPISWRPMPVQSSTRPEVNKPKNNKLPSRFKAKHLKPEQEPTIKIEEYHNGGTPGNTLELPPVNIPVEGGDNSPLALNTFRSEGHLLDDKPQADEDSTTVTKAESMPEIRYQDITRPNTAGTKNKTLKRKRAKSKISSDLKKSVKGQEGSTSEVWVPEEEKLYVYSYSSQPRLLHVRRMAAGRVATTHQWDHDPNSSFRLKIRGNGNPMYDRRVVRGSNYAKRLDSDDHPKWNPYFTNARSLEQHEQMEPEMQHQHQRRQEFREKLEARARLRRDNPGAGVGSLYASHAASGRHYPRSHALVQTENYYEPLERPPESEAEGADGVLGRGGGGAPRHVPLPTRGRRPHPGLRVRAGRHRRGGGDGGGAGESHGEGGGAGGAAGGAGRGLQDQPDRHGFSPRPRQACGRQR